MYTYIIFLVSANVTSVTYETESILPLRNVPMSDNGLLSIDPRTMTSTTAHISTDITTSSLLFRPGSGAYGQYAP